MTEVLVILAALVISLQVPSPSIRGTVFDAANHQAVSDAGVILKNMDTGKFSYATTDGNGEFILTGVKSAQYSLKIAADGYVAQDYDHGRTFQFSNTEKRITFELKRTGTVTGRVRDEAGQPVVDVLVELWNSVIDEDGKRNAKIAYSARTNDAGEFRFFWVTPGRYGMSAGLNNDEVYDQRFGTAAIPRQGMTLASSASGRSYSMIFSPATVNVESDETAGINLTLNSTRGFHIQGQVHSEGNSDAPVSGLILADVTMPQSEIGYRRVPLDVVSRSFDVDDVTPGKYLLIQQPAAGVEFYAWPQLVEVSSSDVYGLSMTVRPTVSIAGVLTPTVGKLEGVMVQLRPSGIAKDTLLSHLIIPQSSKLDVTGTFQIPMVPPGDYDVQVTVPDDLDYFVKDIRFSDVDALSGTIRVPAANSPAMTITMAAHPGEVSGKADSGNIAILAPLNHLDRPDLIRFTKLSVDGRFVFRGIAPGKYEVFAWDEADGFAYFDSEFLGKLRSSARLIEVTESSKQSIEISRGRP